MREIKFRVWDKKYKELIPDVHIAPEYDWLVLSDNDALAERDNRGRGKGEEYILMQYTGLKDKHGTPIYEGDILKWHNYVGAVEWKKNECAFWIHDFKTPQYSDRGWRSIDNKNEIIGNIYQDSHLLDNK